MSEQGSTLPPKLSQTLQSRKVWAGLIGLLTTLLLWSFGEIDGAQALEALTWVLGIFIGSVALEDGMTRLFGTLAHAVATHEPHVPSFSAMADATPWGPRPVPRGNPLGGEGGAPMGFPPLGPENEGKEGAAAIHPGEGEEISERK